jgi:uncharacterized phage protein (TIGR02218 family)
VRTCSAGLATDLALEVTTLARLWHVTRTDGTELFFTDAVRPITYDGDVYRSDITFSSSAIFTSSSMANLQNVTLKVMMDDTAIKENDLRAYKYNGAAGEIMVINYEDVSHGVMSLFKGTFGQIKICDKQIAEIELVPLSASLSGVQIGGETYTATCRNSLGDTRCGIDLEALKVTFTVTAADGAVFEAAEFTEADDFWTQGYVKWLTGDNAGTTGQVRENIQADTEVSLVDVPLNEIQVGDTGEIFPGCDKLPKTCHEVYDNMDNFRGEPNVPSQDILPSLPVGGLRSIQYF